ncbi:MAG: amino acid permease [Spirochaetes bacterium]|nr:amino acid permease [Spirochaetota bacterium]
MSNKTDFNKSLGILEVFAIASGAMISSGIFVLPSIVFLITGPGIILSYFFAGLMVVPALLSQAELATAMPKSGGTYFFAERSLGPAVGTFVGLANWFSISLKSAFALIGIGIFVKLIYPAADPVVIKIVGVFFTLFFLGINLIGVKESGKLQVILVILLILILLFYIITGIEKVNINNYTPFKSAGWGPVFTAAGMVFISFGGLTKVASVAEEVKNPGRTIPAGMILAFFTVMSLYLLAVFVTVGLLKADVLKSSLTPLSAGSYIVMGNIGLVILSVGAVLSFVTTANAGLMSASRVPLAMAKDDILPRFFGNFSKKTRVPYVSLTATALFMITVIVLLDVNNLVKVASTMMLILFLFTNISVILIRASKIVTYKPQFTSPGYPWLQIAGSIVYVIMIIEMGTVPLSITAGFILLSFIWYFIYSKRRYKRDSAIIRIVERVTSSEIKSDYLSEELQGILFERDNIIADRFDALIKSAEIIIIDRHVTDDELFTALSETLSKRLGIDRNVIFGMLKKREEESTTAIFPVMAIPHIIIEGEKRFDIVIVKAAKGVHFSNNNPHVTMVFALAGTKDEREFHLKALMAIAQIVQDHEFEKKWNNARDAEEIRNLILISKRKRKK